MCSVEGTLGYGRAQIITGGGGGGGSGGNVRLNIIGDTSIGSVASGIATARTTQGFVSTLTITSTLLNNYTGSDLTTANYDCILVYTNGGIAFNNNFGNNVNSFITAGGTAVFGVFTWGNVGRITNLDYVNTGFNYNGSQTNGSIVMNNIIPHPITSNVVTNLGSTFYTASLVSPAGASTITTITANSSPFINILSNPRRVGVNIFPPNGGTNGFNLFVRAIWWARGNL